LLEKAWAKIHGSYNRIKWGHSHNLMRDLTGAPAYTYQIKPHIFEKIMEANKRNFLITSSCGKSDLNK
jgi:hypothetical protein